MHFESIVIVCTQREKCTNHSQKFRFTDALKFHPRPPQNAFRGGERMRPAESPGRAGHQSPSIFSLSGVVSKRLNHSDHDPPVGTESGVTPTLDH